MQHTIAVIGLNLGRIDVLGQWDGTREAAVTTLARVHLHLVIISRDGRYAFSSNAQHAAVERYINLRRVQAGGEGIDLDAARRAANINCWYRSLGNRAYVTRQARDAKHIIELTTQALELAEQAVGVM